VVTLARRVVRSDAAGEIARELFEEADLRLHLAGDGIDPLVFDRPAVLFGENVPGGLADSIGFAAPKSAMACALPTFL